MADPRKSYLKTMSKKEWELGVSTGPSAFSAAPPTHPAYASKPGPAFLSNFQPSSCPLNLLSVLGSAQLRHQNTTQA